MTESPLCARCEPCSLEMPPHWIYTTAIGELLLCHFADAETESQKGGRLIQGHPTWNQTQEMCSSPKAVEASRPLDPTSTRSVGFRNSQLHEYKVARIQPTVWFHDLFHSHPIVCKGRGGGGWWLGAWAPQSRGGLVWSITVFLLNLPPCLLSDWFILILDCFKIIEPWPVISTLVWM